MRTESAMRFRIRRVASRRTSQFRYRIVQPPLLENTELVVGLGEAVLVPGCLAQQRLGLLRLSGVPKQDAEIQWRPWRWRRRAPIECDRLGSSPPPSARRSALRNRAQGCRTPRTKRGSRATTCSNRPIAPVSGRRRSPAVPAGSGMSRWRNRTRRAARVRVAPSRHGGVKCTPAPARTGCDDQRSDRLRLLERNRRIEGLAFNRKRAAESSRSAADRGSARSP